MTKYWFFLSYARRDAVGGDYLKRFFRVDTAPDKSAFRYALLERSDNPKDSLKEATLVSAPNRAP